MNQEEENANHSDESNNKTAKQTKNDDRPQLYEFISWLRRTDEIFLLFKGLSILGFIGAITGTIIGSFFQYKVSQHEKSIIKYKEDLEAATRTFAEVATALHAATKLQIAVFSTFSEATKNRSVDDENSFLKKHGSDLYKLYFDEHLSLRKNIDVLARKVEIYIDWPSEVQHDSAKPHKDASLDPINSSLLGAYEFECDKYFPENKPRQIPYKDKTKLPLRIDWKSAKHQLYTRYYCFDIMHKKISAARQWASGSPIEPKERRGNAPSQASLDSAIYRLTVFDTLVMQDIERIRLKFQSTGYLCHVLAIFCNTEASD